MNYITSAVRKIRNFFRREETARLIEPEPDTDDGLEHLERNYYGTADTVSAQYDFFDAKYATVPDLTYLCFPLEPLDVESYRKKKDMTKNKNGTQADKKEKKKEEK